LSIVAVVKRGFAFDIEGGAAWEVAEKVKGWRLIRIAPAIAGKKGHAEMTRASKNAEEL
jgi:hypothetical protein